MPAFTQMLEVLGYRGHSRYVAIYTSEYNEVIYTDGVDEVADVIDRHAWKAYINHKCVRGSVFPYLNRSGAILIDRTLGRLYAGMVEDVRDVVTGLAKINNVRSLFAGNFPMGIQDRIITGNDTPSDLKAILEIIEQFSVGYANAEDAMRQWLKHFYGPNDHADVFVGEI